MTGLLRQRKIINILILETDNFLAGIQEGDSCLGRIEERTMLNERKIKDWTF